MARWKELPEELDPQVHEFASQLRRLVDRSKLSVSAVADRTGYSKSSWERYLNGRLLPPRGAVEALAEVTGTEPGHLTTMWELAERAWSRSEMRHDHTMEAIKVAEARAALGAFGPPPPGMGKAGKGARSKLAPREEESDRRAIPQQRQRAEGPRPEQPGQLGQLGQLGEVRYEPPRPASRPAQGSGRRMALYSALGLVAGASLIAAALFATNSIGDPQDKGTQGKESSSPSSSASALPAGVTCTGADCGGKDPEESGCGGKEKAQTVDEATVGGALVEVRYSKVCEAAWARISGATQGDTVKIQSVAKGSQSVGESAKAGEDMGGYTPMIAVEDPADARACASLLSGAKGCTAKETP